METETINGYVNIPYEIDSEATFHIPEIRNLLTNISKKLIGRAPFPTAYSIGTLRKAKLEDEEYPTGSLNGSNHAH
jgi:hypothetical protein